MVKTEVTASIGSIASATFGSALVTVSGVTGDMCIDAVFASAHSAGYYIQQCKVLSTNNLQVDFYNTTNAAIVHGPTLLRFISK